jgi:hypothetical protein
MITTMRLFLISCVALVGSNCGRADIGGQEAEHNTLSAAEVEAGWQLLFDGETTSGWRGYNQESLPERGWEVLEGDLVILPRAADAEAWGGDIVTEGVFDNFELSLEFNLTTAANSGIFYRVVEVPGESIWHFAPEYQVLDNAGYIALGDTDTLTHLTGDNYDLHASSSSAIKPAGEWNHARIVVDRGHVEHWLNGVKMVEYELWSPDWEQRVRDSKFGDYPEYGRATMGQIALQDHGNEVRFRNIKIRPIGQ